MMDGNEALVVIRMLTTLALSGFPIPNVTLSPTPNIWEQKVDSPGFIAFQSICLIWTGVLMVLIVVLWILRVKIEEGFYFFFF